MQNITNNINYNYIINHIRQNKNTGSTKIQIFFLTYKINKLHQHFHIHKKDYHSKKGLLKLVFQRRKLLIYLKKKNLNKYYFILHELHLRN